MSSALALPFVYMTIGCGNLPFGVFEEISKAFELEPHLLPVTAEELKQSFEEGLSMVVTLYGAPIAHTRLIPLLSSPRAEVGQWYELGGTWVSESYRGHNLNTQMYQQFLAFHEDKKILATTTNPFSLLVGDHFGFVLVLRKQLPVLVWQASCCCPAKKTGTDNNSQCQMAYGEPQQDGPCCWFRVTKPTADLWSLTTG